MSEPVINLQLSIGKVLPSPVPLYISETIESVQVTRTMEGPSGFQITFRADRTKGLSSDYKLLSSPLLKPFNRVWITVTLNGTPHILMDGFITNQELNHQQRYGNATLTVTGQDVGVVMDIYEYSMEYGTVGDAVVAAMVLAKYIPLVGVIPEIPPTPSGLIPISEEHVVQQNATDLAYLRQLADAHRYIFYIKPGPISGTNTAYWGPPLYIGSQQKALTVDSGPGTNVKSISFKYDGRAPQLVHGMVQDDMTELDLPILTLVSTRLPYLSTEQAVISNQPYVNNVSFTDPRLGYLRAADFATAGTDASTEKVVTVTGEVDAMRYLSVLDVPGLVPIRGAGNSYDGLYYVRQVTHNISRGQYSQQFTLTREGTGSTISEVSNV